jgi:hypothetical protein
MALRADELVNLKGKFHPLYRGILREAHDNGLIELSVKLIEAPTAENGQTAICEATAVFPGREGRERIFTEIGDCNERNCTPMIAAHRIRMAATRAKGRALRDALGIGEALVEEMGPDHDRELLGNGEADRARSGGNPAPASREQSRARGSSAPVGAAAGNSGTAPGSLAERDDAPAVAPMSHWCEDCGQEIQGTETKKGSVSADVIAKVSVQRWGKLLCHACGRKLIQIETANVPAGQIAA